MEFYFTDRSFRLLGIATAGSDSTNDFRISGEIERTNVDAAMVAFTGTLYFPKKQLSKAESMCQDLNYMLYMDDDGNGRMITITASHADGTGYSIAFEGTDAGNDLKNEIVASYTATKQMTFEQYFDIFTTNSGWEIGVNEIPTDVRTLTFDSEETSYDRMNSVATQFGVETYFSFSIVGTTMVKCYLNVVKKRGANRGVTLRVGDEINRITVDSDSTNLMTSIFARGATPDGSETPINLVGYSYTDPTGQFVLVKEGFLLDTVSNRIYSRLRQNSTATIEGGYLNHVVDYQATTQDSLLQSALSDLKKNNHPAVNYTIELAKIPQNVRCGDTVQIEQEDRQLYLSARVLELDKCYSNPSSSTIVMGDYLIETSQIDPQYRALAEELAKQNKGKDGVGLKSSIVTYQAGTSGTTAPTGVWSEAIPTVPPSQFLWSRTVLTLTDGSTSTTYSVGKIGDNGVPGADGNGIKSSTVTYQIGTSGTIAPTGTWSLTIPPASQGTYLWSRTVTLYTDGNQNTSYSVAYQGINGPQGDQGLPGTDGADGRTTYAHFAYANSQDGNTDFSTTDPNRKYIGFYSDFTSGDSKNHSDYNWSLIKGTDGADGKDGVPGKPGVDGRTPYFHIAYADSSDGKTNFSLDIPGSRKYIGQYTDFTQADSTNQASYKWQLVQGPKGDTGADGVAGKDGVGIKSTQIMYAQSTSGTAAPTTGWTAQVPTLIKGQYLWTQTTWVYTDNTGESGYTVSYNAKDGNTGADGIAGKDGVGIKSTTITYQSGTSGTVKPTGTWVSNPPSVTAGNYLWTRTIWSYTDGTSETGYSVAKMGEKGDKGDKGDTGVGVAGKAGADGKTPYLHTAWSWSSDGKDRFMTSYPKENLLLGSEAPVMDLYMASATGTTISSVKTSDGWQRFVLNNGSIKVQGGELLPHTQISLNVIAGTTYTQSLEIRTDATVDLSTTDKLTWFSNDYGHNLQTATMTKIGDQTYFISCTYTPEETKTVRALDMYLYNIAYTTSGTYLDFRHGKASISKNVTPWTPSPSEDPVNAYPVYRGEYTDYTEADSTDPTKYTWIKVKGDTGADGVAGKDGVGIKSTSVTYQASTSGTTAPTGTWVASPTASAGQYQWTRTVWTYTDGTTETGYSVGHIGADGATGADGIAGKDGVGITATAVTYQASTSGTTAPTGTWLTVPPTVAAGKFLWTRMIWTYTDGTTETGYSVAQMGKTGATGAQGATGPQGERGKQIFKSSCEYVQNTSGHWWSDLSPAPSVDNPPQIGDTVITPAGNIFQISSVNVGGGGGGGLFGVGDVLGNIKGPQGPKGNDITSYASGLTLPSTVAPANSQFWLVDTNNVAIKFYKSTGSSWVEQQISAAAISAATFNGLTFNGVTFNGSTFKSTFNGIQPDGASFTVNGTSTLGNGVLSTLAYRDSDNSLYSATDVSPTDIGSVLYDNGSKFDEIRLREGQLYLGGLYKETASSDAVWKSGIITPMQLLMMQRSGLVLWSGVSLMSGSQSITPSLKLNECLNGWLLNWSGYNPNTHVVSNGQMSYTLIPKSHVGYGGAAIANFIYVGGAGQKYIYASNTTLTGNDVNTSAGPQMSSVLRAVYAF